MPVLCALYLIDKYQFDGRYADLIWTRGSYAGQQYEQQLVAPLRGCALKHRGQRVRRQKKKDAFRRPRNFDCTFRVSRQRVPVYHVAYDGAQENPLS